MRATRPATADARLVEVLIRLVEGGDGDVDDLELADGAVAAERLDEDGGHRLNGDAFAVELHVALAFEDEVDLGHPFMVVGLGVLEDLDEVHGRGGVVWGGEGAPGPAAGA